MPESGIEAGIIKDARARQRRHRTVGSIVLALVIAAGWVTLGLTGGGGGGGGGSPTGGPSPAAPAPAVGHATGSKAFPGAPVTHPGSIDESGSACHRAPANRYLPRWSGCVSARIANVAGGEPSLVLVYSTLGHHPYLDARKGTHDPYYVAKQAMLRVVERTGQVLGTPIAPVDRNATTVAVLLATARLARTPGEQMLLWTASVSNVNYAEIYSLAHGRLVVAGPTLQYTSRSPTSPSGFSCQAGTPPRVTQNFFNLDGHGDLFARYQQVSVTYAWHGPRLVRVSRNVTQHNHPVPPAQARVGATCLHGIR